MKVKASNWESIEADFEDGLKPLANGSIAKIRSDLALGYYMSSHDSPKDFLARFLPNAMKYQPVETCGRAARLYSVLRGSGENSDYRKAVEYTTRVLDLCHNKLCEGCDLIIRAEANGVSAIEEAVKASKFNIAKDMQIKPILKPDEHTSSWEQTLRLPGLRLLNRFSDVTLTKRSNSIV